MRLSGRSLILFGRNTSASTVGILLSASQDTEGDAQGTAIGIISGGTGPYTVTDATNTTQVVSGNQLQVGPVAPSVGTITITLHDTGVPAAPDRNFTITTIASLVAGPDAPSISWTSAATDNTPNFDVDLPSGLGAPGDVQSGDILTLEYNGGAGWVTYLSHTITSGDISSDTINESSVSSISDGAYSFRAKLSRTGARTSPNSNVVSVTIDTTPPTITSSSSFSWPENSAFSQQLTANETVTWTLTGGADEALFSITTGGLLTTPAKDFENPTDADDNNVYVVQATATDTAGNATNQTISLTITDVADTTTRQAQFGPFYINETAAGAKQAQYGNIYVNEA